MRQQTTDQHTHRIGLRGHAVAPDLSSVSSRIPSPLAGVGSGWGGDPRPGGGGFTLTLALPRRGGGRDRRPFSRRRL